MSLLKQLQKQGTLRGRRWTIRRDKKTDKITDVKMIFNPDEYREQPNSREMYGDRELIHILLKEKEKNG